MLDAASGLIRGIHAPYPAGGKTVQIGSPADLSCLFVYQEGELTA